MMGVKIKYGDIAPEAKENFVPSASEQAEFVDLTQLNKYNLRVGNYANPCELYQTILDSSTEVFPEYPESVNMGYWSESISDEDGTFDPPIVLSFQSAGKYSSQGLTFTFDTENKIFPSSLNIKWYQGDTLLDDMDFTPDSAFYFCRNQVKYYNRVVVTFNRLNMPKNRLKLRSVDYGYGTFFDGDELRNVDLIQDINPISATLPISVCDFTLDSKSDMEYSFQAKQPLSVFFNNELKATVFVEKSRRTAKRIWSINGEDYVGIMDGIKFMGGMYENEVVYDLLDLILTEGKIPHTIDESLKNVKISGHIPICTLREGVRRICFASGSVVKTQNTETLDIVILSNEVSQVITKRRIRQGQSFEDSDKITEVQLVEHTYTAVSDSDKKVVVYEAEKSGTGENIFVEFSEPLHDLKVAGGTFAVDDKGRELKGVNYAVINITSELGGLSGYPYRDDKVVKSKKLENLLAGDLENIHKIEDETLVSSLNSESVLDRCFDYYTKTSKIKMNIEDGKHRVKYGELKYGTFKYGQYVFDKPVNVGDYIACETEYMGTPEGRLTSVRFKLNGGIVLKECDMI